MRNMILSAIVVILVALLPAVSQANQKNILLISDIDDTIKISNILNLPAKYARALNFTTPFTGMSELYQLLVAEHQGRIQVAYLSNSPQKIQGVEVMPFSHGNFLALNAFPQGELLLRADTKDQNHKIRSIRRLAAQLQPDLIIMVGDNGERDIQIYAQATQELQAAGIATETYIHQVYSSQNLFFDIGKKLQTGQVGFVTAFEIALDLNKKSLFSQDSIEWMAKEIMPLILAEDYFELDTLGSVAFPSFMNCRDFRWTTKVPTLLLPLASKINKRCR